MMRHIGSTAGRPPKFAAAMLIAVAALAALLAPIATGSAPKAISKTVAKKAANKTLEETVLTNLRNRTLYTLSDETHGRFFCNGSCLAVWPPLILPKNAQPLGPTRLGKVKRADGRFQVTFKGRPLYTYSGDAKPAEANGEGLVLGKGVWHAAGLGKLTPAPTPEPQPQPSPSPYPY
jgi:predicted lipoprotein with Yx(FWY)xxD motif